MGATTPERDFLDIIGFRSHWFWREFTALLLVLMELSWLVPWYRTVIQVSYVASIPRTFLVLAGLMLTAYYLVLILEALRLLPGLQRGILLAMLLFSLFVAAKLLLDPQNPNLLASLANLEQGAVLIIMVSLWLWWRGINIARNMITPRVVWKRFWLTLVMLIFYFLIITPKTRETVGFGVLELFFCTGLLAMVSARIFFIGRFHGTKKSPFGQRWLVGTSLTVAGIVGLATLLASLITGRFSFLLDQLATGIKSLAVLLFFIFSIPWLFLSYLLSPVIARIQNSLPQVTATPTPTPEAYELATQFPGSLQTPPPYQPLSPFFVSLIFWGVVLSLVFVFFLSARGQTRRKEREDVEETESLLDSEDLLRVLRSSLQEQVKNVGDRLAKATRLTRRQRRLAATRVRRIYAHLLDLADELDSPRREAATPMEFLPDLQTLLPAYQEELVLITHSYIRIRYGELPETQEEVQAMEAAWKRIYQEGQKLKKALRAREERSEGL